LLLARMERQVLPIATPDVLPGMTLSVTGRGITLALAAGVR